MGANRDRVTNLVANYIGNEGDMDVDGTGRIAEIATSLADKGDTQGVREYVVGIIRTHPSGFTKEVKDQLSAEDWSDIDWDEVTRQIRT